MSLTRLVSWINHTMKTNEEVLRKLKRLKWALFISGLLFWGGVVWGFFGLIGLGGERGKDPVSELMPQIIMMAMGFVWYLYIQIRFWMLNE